MQSSRGGLLGIAVVLLLAAVASAAPKGILSDGPEDADTSFILDSRGGVETFQGTMPDEELLAMHEILKEDFNQKAKVAKQAEMNGQESPVKPGSEYQVAYEVHAPSTGDEKSLIENRHEDGIVSGQYTIRDADGTLRVVSYHSTPEEGFKAIVKKKEVDSSHKPSTPDVGEVINVDRLGIYDDSNEQVMARNFNIGSENEEINIQIRNNNDPTYYSGFRSGFSRPSEQENHKNVEYNVVANRFERNQVEVTKETMENISDDMQMRYDGQFGTKITPNKQLYAYQGQRQNIEMHQDSDSAVHVQESMQNRSFKSQIIPREQYSAHIQDNNQQLDHQNIRQSQNIPQEQYSALNQNKNQQLDNQNKRQSQNLQQEQYSALIQDNSQQHDHHNVRQSQNMPQEQYSSLIQDNNQQHDYQNFRKNLNIPQEQYSVHIQDSNNQQLDHQNMRKPEMPKEHYSVHIQHNNNQQLDYQNMKKSEMPKEQYSVHIQDNNNQQLDYQNIRKSEHSSHITNSVENKPLYQVIPVSINKDSSKMFSFNGSLSPVYNMSADVLKNSDVNNNYKGQAKRKIPFTVVPVFLRRVA